VLLDSGLLQERDRPHFFLVDEFSGHPDDRVELDVYMPNGGVARVPALRWRRGTYSPGEPLIRLHHLHGSGMWMRLADDVYKATELQHLREIGLYTGVGSRG